MVVMDFRKLPSTAIAGAIVTAALFFTLGYKQGEDAALSSAAATYLKNTSEGQPTDVDFGPFWKAWSIINRDFVPTGTSTKLATDEDKVWGAIGGMVESLGDPYTVFFPPVEAKQFAADIKGSFGGVGMEVGQENGVITVITPLKGSPAEAAGIRKGDKILKIGDKDTARLTTDEAVRMIRGEEGTPVTLTVSRTGRAPFEVTIVRQLINIPTIETKSLGDGIFYIALFSFTENSPNLFRAALREFIESGDTKLVLDLRGNPGGYLEAALDMASWFLPPGAVVIREERGQDKEENTYRSRGYDIFNENLKFVILVDEGSASASEILAGALSEHGKATLVGEKTFGKGSVQELLPVTPDTSIKVTIARWLTPNGKSISDEGIVPDISIKPTEADIKAGKDVQLDRAIQFLKTGK
jgi:carboxyl-terminal processing protease